MVFLWSLVISCMNKEDNLNSLKKWFSLWPPDGTLQLTRNAILRQESEAAEACSQVSSYNKRKLPPMIQARLFAPSCLEIMIG